LRFLRRQREPAPISEELVSTEGFDHQVVDKVWVRELLRCLPEQRRVVLILSYFEGLDEAEIANMMNLNVNTVKSMKRRSLIDLRQRIHEEHLVELNADA